MKASFNEIAARLGSESSSLTIIDTLLTDSRSLTRPESSVFFAIATPGGTMDIIISVNCTAVA